MYINVRPSERLFLVIVLCAVALSLLWPADAFWMNHEQALIIDQALLANASGRLSSFGRGATTVISAHPLTFWVYQFLLLITHDVVKIIFIKQMVVLSVCLAGLCYLSKALNFNRYAILICLFSLCHYALNRLQVDGGLLSPVSLMMFVFFAWFSRRRGYAPLICLAVCVTVMIHLNHRGLVAAVPFLVTFFAF